jgi:Fuc2NAc and GlcNAc transferase
MLLWLSSVLIAFVVSYFACDRVRLIAEASGMIAQPGERQSHVRPTPTGGGLGMVFSIVITSVLIQFYWPLPAFWWQYAVPGFLLLALIGWFDDKHSVSSLLRLLVQLAVSLWLLGFAWSGFSLGHLMLSVVGTVAVIWVMNLYNFMDGSNGMAGFQGLFTGLVLALSFYSGGAHGMALLSLVIASACAGFLPLNFPRARVFMGDVASVPLGFIFAALILYGLETGGLHWPVALLVLSLFVVDATLTLLRRVFRGERWYTAHAQHVYQRLIAHGWPHSRVLVLYQAINVLWVLPVAVLAEMYPANAMTIVVMTYCLLGTCWYVANWRLGMIDSEQVK